MKFDETRIPRKSPSETGKKRFRPYGYYNNEYPCTCQEDCPLTCKGECGCEAHWNMFEDWRKKNAKA